MKKKKIEKETKIYKKTQSKNHSLNFRKLALNNSQIIEVGIFREIIFDLLITFNKFTSDTGNLSTSTVFLEARLIENHIFSNKKKLKVKYWLGV